MDSTMPECGILNEAWAAGFKASMPGIGPRRQDAYPGAQPQFIFPDSPDPGAEQQHDESEHFDSPHRGPATTRTCTMMVAATTRARRRFIGNPVRVTFLKLNIYRFGLVLSIFRAKSESGPAGFHPAARPEAATRRPRKATKHGSGRIPGRRPSTH